MTFRTVNMPPSPASPNRAAGYSLHDSEERDEFANSQAIVQPVAFQTCTTVAAHPPTVRRVKHTRKAAK